MQTTSIPAEKLSAGMFLVVDKLLLARNRFHTAMEGKALEVILVDERPHPFIKLIAECQREDGEPVTAWLPPQVTVVATEDGF